jgi:hypothetical protein
MVADVVRDRALAASSGRAIHVIGGNVAPLATLTASQRRREHKGDLTLPHSSDEWCARRAAPQARCASENRACVGRRDEPMDQARLNVIMVGASHTVELARFARRERTRIRALDEVVRPIERMRSQSTGSFVRRVADPRTVLRAIRRDSYGRSA